MRQESFIFFTSWLEAIKPYDEDMQNQIIRMILDYAIYGVEPDLSALSSEFHTVFTLVKPLIDVHKRNKENGNLGGRPKTKKTHEKTPLKTSGFENKKPNDNVNDNVNDNDKEKEKEKEDVATSSCVCVSKKKTYVNPLEKEVIRTSEFREFREWQKKNIPEIMKMHYTNFITEEEFWDLMLKIEPEISEDEDKQKPAIEKIKSMLLKIQNRTDKRGIYSNLFITTLEWLKRNDDIKDENASVEKLRKHQ